MPIGVPFIIDDGNTKTPSEIYDLYIVSINGNNLSEKSLGGQIKTITEDDDNKVEKLFLGCQQTPVLSFTLDIICDSGMDMQKSLHIYNWLFTHKGYRKLQICDNRTQDYYFNCVLIPVNFFEFCDGIRGVRCTIECDSPYAWTFLKSKQYNNIVFSKSIKMLNNSADIETLKPYIEFKMSQSGNFKIINKSANDLTFGFNGLITDEIIRSPRFKRSK